MNNLGFLNGRRICAVENSVVIPVNGDELFSLSLLMEDGVQKACADESG